MKNKNNMYSFQSLCEPCLVFHEQGVHVNCILPEIPQICSQCTGYFGHVSKDTWSGDTVSYCRTLHDLIGYLEKAETNPADITVQFLTLQVHFDNMEAKCYICNKFIDVAVGIISKWYKQYFLHPVYVIAMYLSPKYCNLAISKNFSHDYLKPEIVKLAMNWMFKKDECIQLAQDIHKYNSFIFTKDHKTMTLMYF